MRKIKQIDISALRDYTNNARNNALAVEKVRMSIERFGFLFPIVVDSQNVIVCGHTRKKACESIGLRKVPCIVIDDLTEDQVNFFRIVDNRTSEYASWDYRRLEEELAAIDLSITVNELFLKSYDFELNSFGLNASQYEVPVDNFNFMSDDGGALDPDEEPDHDLGKARYHLFVCGGNRFYISEIELGLLHKAYADYLDRQDSGKSLVRIILGGSEGDD